MKKLIILILAIVPMVAFGQLYTPLGTPHTITGGGMGEANTSDSVHYFGRVDISQCDSINIMISNQDSLKADLQLKFVGRYATSDTIGISHIGASANEAAAAIQLTAADNTGYSWLNISTAAKEEFPTSMGLVDVYVYVYATGSEIGSQGDKFSVYVKRYLRR